MTVILQGQSLYIITHYSQLQYLSDHFQYLTII